jgi:hypothetical protein
VDQKLAYFEIKVQRDTVTIDHPAMNALDMGSEEGGIIIFLS